MKVVCDQFREKTTQHYALPNNLTVNTDSDRSTMFLTLTKHGTKRNMELDILTPMRFMGLQEQDVVGVLYLIRLLMT